MSRRRSTALLGSVALAAAALTTPVQAAPGFVSDVATLTAHQSAGQYEVAVAPDGTAHAVWIEETGTNFLLMWSRRPAGGSWSTPVQVDTGSTTQDASPAVAVDGEGRVVAVWRDYLPERRGSVIRTATLAGAGWGAAQDLSPSTTHAFEPAVAVDAGGDAAVAWSQNVGTGEPGTILGGAYRPSGGAWATSSAAGAPAANHVAVTVQRDGRAIVLFNDGAVHATDLSRSATFGPAHLLSSANSQHLGIVTDTAGHSTAAWSTDSTVQTATRPEGGAWGSTTSFGGPDGGLATQVDIGVGDDGDALAAWIASTPGNTTATPVVASREAGGTWTTTSVPVPETYASAPTVAFGTGGASVVMWTAGVEQMAPNRVLYAVTRLPGEAWSAPTALASGPVGGPRAAIDEAGHGTLVWNETGGALRSQVFDGVGPTVTGLAKHVLVRSGRATSYKVSASDVWSKPSVAWTFDDRAPVNGRKVRRSLTSGMHDLEVSATDSAGNTTVRASVAVVAGKAPRVRRVDLVRKQSRLVLRLSAPALVRVQVLKRSGKVVATVERALDSGRGRIDLTRDALGIRKGSYAVRVLARNALGRDVSAKLPLRVGR